MICTAGILFAIPLARSLQKLIYTYAGKKFFTYIVILSVCLFMAAALFKYPIKKASQYGWLFICGCVYIYSTLQLGKHPEEAFHFVEYGILSYFLFSALSARVRDRTIYITVILFAAFVGTFDEFIQWMMPGRKWDYRDVGLNVFSSFIFMFAVWKGIRPEIISGSVKKFSLKILAAILTADLIFFGLCLANTPDMVKRYTSVFESLSWLRDEEPMTKFMLFRDDKTDEKR